MSEEVMPKKEGLTELKEVKKIPSSPIANELEIEYEAVDPDGVPIEDQEKKPTQKEGIEKEGIENNREKTIENPAKKEEPEKSKIPEPSKVVEFAQAATLQKLGELSERLAKMEKQVATGQEVLTQIQEKFDKKIAVDGHSQNLFSAMHAELKSYKDAALFDVFHKPYLKDMILVFDDLNKMEKQAEKIGEKIQEKADDFKDDFSHHLNNIENIKALVLELLNRMDVELIDDAEITSIDKQYHKIVNTVKTDNADDDGKIAERVGRGFRWRGKLLRHEEVIIYKNEKI